MMMEACEQVILIIKNNRNANNLLAHKMMHSS